MRERPGAGGNVAAGTRITPACAGKTYIVAGRADQARDHPRMCGKDQPVVLR